MAAVVPGGSARSPEAATCAQADAIGARSLRAAGFGARAIERAVATKPPLSEVVDELTVKPAERAALKRLLRDMEAPVTSTGSRQGEAGKNRSRQGLRGHRLLRSTDASSPACS